MSTRLAILTTVAAIGSGIVGGVFFAFSTFVMKALDRLPPAHSISAMQAINKAAPNAWFMAALFGTAIACVAVGIAAVVRWGEAGATYQLVGAVLYLAVIVLTIAYHIPRNESLATIDPNTADAARQWPAYSSGWTAWNHVRTIAPIASAAMFTTALRIG